MDKLIGIPGPKEFIRYLASIKVYIAIVVVLFLCSMAIGYVIPITSPDVAQSMVSGLESKAAELSGQSQPMMMLGIFFNNALASMVSLLLGLVAGIVPLLFVLSNGMVIGIILEMVISKAGMADGITLFLVGILPHGIFELPAVLISTAIGLKLGYSAIKSVLSRKDLVTDELKNGLLIFFFWILPILLIAAVIETYVTGALLAYFVHSPIF